MNIQNLGRCANDKPVSLQAIKDVAGGGIGIPNVQVGSIRERLFNINDVLNDMNKTLAQIEAIVFSPRPTECCGINGEPVPANDILFTELDKVTSRISSHNQRITELLDVLRSQLGCDLKLV